MKYINYVKNRKVCEKQARVPDFVPLLKTSDTAGTDHRHPIHEMVVTALNVGAAHGESMMPEGLRSLIYDVGPSEAPWRIYGVRP